MASDDALDIELTEGDFEDMDPKDLVNIHNKLRQSRRTMKEEREQLQKQLADQREMTARMQNTAQWAVEQAKQRDARLARLAMTLIDRGVLDQVNLPEANDAG